MDKKITTAGGYKRLEDLHKKVKEQYFEVCSDNSAAAESGDTSVWHDNFAYEENQRQMYQLATRIKEIEHLLNEIEVIATFYTAPATVQVGTCVQIFQESLNEEQEFFIAGFQDGDMMLGRLSYTSPIGKALLGLYEGESIELTINDRLETIEVLAITLPSNPHHN